MAHEAGKGDRLRPVDTKKFESSHEAIFGNKPVTRGSFVWDESQQKMVPKEEYYANRTESSAPMVIGDIQPYQSMVTGEEITSRSKHREHLRQHGMVEVGNEVGFFQKTQEKKREHSQQEIKQLREQVARQVYEKLR